MEDLRNESYNEGRAEGCTEGRELQAKETAFNLRKEGFSIEVIAKAINYNVEVVRKWLVSSTI